MYSQPATAAKIAKKGIFPAIYQGAAATPKSFRGVQFLRFVAAALVVIHHTNLSLHDLGLGEDSFDMLRLTDFGQSGVHLFFVISGFIMVFTAASSAGSLRAAQMFLLRRFLRIYPIYWIYAALCLVLYPAVSSPYGFTPREGLAALALLPGHAYRIITPGWTLTYEIYFYICFGLCLLLPFRWGITVLSLFFIASIAAGRLWGPVTSPVLYLLSSPLLLEFLFGAWICTFLLFGPRVRQWWAGVLFVLAAVTFSLSILLGESVPAVIGWGIPSALLVGAVTVSELKDGLPKWVADWSFLGDSSYSLYLLHMLIIHLTLKGALASGATADLGTFCGMIAATMAVAGGYVAYHIVERPLQSFLAGMLRSGLRPQRRRA